MVITFTGEAQEGEGQAKTRTLALVDTIGGTIVRGEYASKSFPTEAVLAEQHGTSRSITREAVKMLTAKGLLGARPRVGIFVQPEENWNLFDIDVLRWMMEQNLSRALLRQFNELRMTVEPQAAAFAARRATPRQVTAIRAGLQDMQAAAQGEGDMLSADLAFHVAILRASGNPFLSQFRHLIDIALRTSIRVTNRQAGGRVSLPDHEKVYEAIATGNAAAAQAAMAKLIGDVLEYLDGLPNEI